MKTAISLPDDLFGRAEDFAARAGMSRSELYRRALHEYLMRRDSALLTAAMDEAIADLGERADDRRWTSTASARVLADTEW